MVRDVITQQTHICMSLLWGQLQDEVLYKYYPRGKGKPGSPAKALRMYGFKSKPKKKLLKEVTIYLNTVEIV